MDCRILRSVTLKSDGHLCCDDSSGYRVHLGEVSTKQAWNIKAVFEAPVMRHVRQSFAAGRVPWPGTCEGCDLFSPGGVPLDTLASRIEVRIEPTLACELRCPGCERMKEVVRREGDWHLNPALFENLLKSLVSSHIEIPTIIYLGLGEPLEHPDFGSLVEMASRIAPTARQEVTTNGNQGYCESIGAARLDRIIVSCDGLHQSSYVKYRIRGEVDRALQFMRDVRKYATHQPFLEWKYILFEFNDSDEELMEAQKVAEDIGVDSMMFIGTNTRFHSTRFLADGLFSFPRISPIVSISPAAAMQRILRTGRVSIARSDSSGLYCMFRVDVCTLLTCGVVRLEGWVLGADGSYADGMEVFLGDQLISSSWYANRRPDVPKVYGQAEGPDCGYVLQFPFSTRDITAPPAPPGEIAISLRIRITIGESEARSEAWMSCTAFFPEFDPAVFSARYSLPPDAAHETAPLVSIQSAN
jgi:organic radical activating enzyme